MEIREITTDHPNAPFTGYGVYVVLERVSTRARLFHPVRLTEFYLVEYDFVKGRGDQIWPKNETGSDFNKDQWIRRLRQRVASLAAIGRPFPVQTVAWVLSEVCGTEIEDELRFIGGVSVDEDGNSTSKSLSTKANREYSIRADVDPMEYRGRKRTVLCAFKEHGSASIHQIMALVDGKLQTKCDLGRTVTYFVNKFAREGILEISD